VVWRQEGLVGTFYGAAPANPAPSGGAGPAAPLLPPALGERDKHRIGLGLDREDAGPAGNAGLRDFKLSWEPLVHGALGGKPEPAGTGEGMATRVLGPVIRHGLLLLCCAVGETLYRYAA
jgi:hypothetical protein